MNEASVKKLIKDFLQAWNSRDADMVAACYSEDLIYRDPNTRGEIRDQKSFRRYLKKLLASWDMTWTEKEAFNVRNSDTWAFLWRAQIRKPDGSREVEIDGMDLVVLSNGLIARNEVYFDRLALAPLFGGLVKPGEKSDEGIQDFLMLLDG